MVTDADLNNALEAAEKAGVVTVLDRARALQQVPDESNAYTVLTDFLSDELSDRVKVNLGRIEGVSIDPPDVQLCEDVVRALAVASRKEFYRPNLDYGFGHAPRDDLIPLKNIVKLALLLQADKSGDDPQGLFETVESALRISSLVGAGGTQFTEILRLALANIALKAIIEGFAKAKDSRLAELVIAGLPAQLEVPTFKAVLEVEFAVLLLYSRNVETYGGYANLERLHMADRIKEYGRMESDAVPKGDENRKVLADLLSCLSSFYEQVGDRLVSEPEAELAIKRLIQTGPQLSLTRKHFKDCVDHVGKICLSHKMSQNAFRVCHALAAIYRYREVNSTWPKSLNELEVVPIDSYSGRPMHYSLVGGRPVVSYSLPSSHLGRRWSNRLLIISLFGRRYLAKLVLMMTRRRSPDRS